MWRARLGEHHGERPNDAKDKMRDAAEERAQQESRLTGLECRVQLMEREAAAAARSASAAGDID